MKTFNIFLSLTLLSISLLATDKSYSFLGIQAGNSFVNGVNSPNIGLKYGSQSGKYRTAFFYSYGDSSKRNLQMLLSQVDVGIFKNSFKNSPVKPYIGLTFGVMQEEDKQSSIRDRGYLYGVDTGLAYIFNDALDFDLNYRYLSTSKINNIDSISDLTLSMHYFY